MAIQPWFGDRLAYATLYPGVELAALLGGFASGVVATFLSAGFVHLWFAPLSARSDWLGLALFLISGAGISAITEALLRTRTRLGVFEARSLVADRRRVESESLRLAISAGAIATWDLDIAANRSTVGPEFQEIFGFAQQTIVNPAAVFAVVQPEDLPDVRIAFDAALNPNGDGLYRCEYRIVRPSDGEERWVSARAHTFFENGRPRRMIGVVRDVTGERLAAMALAEKAKLAAQLSKIAAAAPGVIFSFRRSRSGAKSFPYVSPNLYALSGLRPEEVSRTPRAFFRRLRPADLKRIKERLSISAGVLVTCNDTLRYLHPKRGESWLEFHASPMLESNGDVLWHGYAGDVTERRRAEFALVESEARLRAILNGAKDGILSIDSRGTVLSINTAGQRIFGYAEEEIRGRNISLLMPARFAESHDEQLRKARSKKRVNAHFLNNELAGQRKDGQEFPIELRVIDVQLNGKVLFVGFVRDVSELYQIEARVEKLQEERLSGLGGMADGIAHELNQPLAAAATYLESVQRLVSAARHPLGQQIELYLERAAEEIARSGQILRRLRDFVARGEPEKSVESLHELIETTIKSTEHACGAHIQVTYVFNAHDDSVLMDKIQIGQVLFNLVRNAQEAMRGVRQPKLVIATASVEAGMVQVDVIDTGHGFEGNTEENLFEPFITTKPTGKGLGLAISRSIVAAHDGRLWARENQAGGAIFSFTLPLAIMETEE